MHTNTQFSALMCALSPTTCQILSLPLGGHIMQLHSQIEREAWMKMIRTDNFAEKGQRFFSFLQEKGRREMKKIGKTHTDSTLWGRVTLTGRIFDLQCKKEQTGSRQNFQFLGYYTQFYHAMCKLYILDQKVLAI